MTTSQPPAGWYSDPSNPTAERWWNGSGWGHETRAPVPTAPVAQQQFMGASSVLGASSPAMSAPAMSTPGVNTLSTPIPGMSVSALAIAPETPTAAAVTGATQAAPTTTGQLASTSSAPSTIGSYIPPLDDPHQAGFSTGRFGTQIPNSWGAVSRPIGPPPTNPAATRALVFGIVSWFVNPLLIFSFVALSSGKQGLSRANMLRYETGIAVGHAAATWGRALAIVSLLFTLAVVALGGWLFYNSRMVYNDDAIEAGFAAGAADAGMEGATLDCPEEGSMASGSSFDCTAFLPDGRTLVIRMTVNNPWTEDYSFALAE